MKLYLILCLCLLWSLSGCLINELQLACSLKNIPMSDREEQTVTCCRLYVALTWFQITAGKIFSLTCLFIAGKVSQIIPWWLIKQERFFFLNHAAFMSHIISPSLLTFFTHWLIYYNFFFFFASSFLWNQRHHEGTLNLMNPMLFGMIRATAGETLHCIPVQRAHIYIQPSSSQLWAWFFLFVVCSSKPPSRSKACSACT